MKVLITGGSGLLGKYLIATAPEGYDITATYFRHSLMPSGGINIEEMDLASPEQVWGLFDRTKPDLVIHTAALGSVDFAETDPEIAYRLNVEGTKLIAESAKRHESKVIHISSNAVFGGNNPPYDSDSPQHPVNNYGRIKSQSELIIKETLADYLIIRPYMLYGWNHPWGRENWVTTIIRQIEGQIDRPLYLVNDVVWMPTYAGDVAMGIWKLARNHTNCDFNIAAKEQMTLFDFGVKVCEVWGLDPTNLIPVSSDHFPGIAPRPKNTAYSLGDVKRSGIIPLDVYEGLQKMKEDKF